MKILITNDDGVYASGIIKLAEVAKNFGEVTVVAPEGQCSAMSHRITIGAGIKVKEIHDFPVKGIPVYSIGGTPADCTKVAVEYLMVEKPDIVFSGINKGYNAGMDVAYSGTVAAAMQAVMKGIPAIAFSMSYEEHYELVNEKLYEIIEQLIDKPAGHGKMWNVNFPECTLADYKGIHWNTAVAKADLFPDAYEVVDEDSESKTIQLHGVRAKDFPENTDLYALLHGYISIGTITNMIVGQ